MKRPAAVMTAALMTAMFVGLSAQTKPNCAGQWMFQVDPNAAVPAARGRGNARSGGGARGWPPCGVECTITQDATTLTFIRTTQPGEQKTEYKLVGTEATT